MNTSPLQPAAKRVRWDDSVRSDYGLDMRTCKGDDHGEPQPVQQAEVSCSANGAIGLMGVRTIAEISGTEKKNIHRPSFTHQLFNEEKIVGYADGEVNIRVVYSAKSLEFLVEIKTIDDDPIRKADILSRLSKALPSQGFSTDASDFCRILGQTREEFKVPGCRVHAYKRNGCSFAVYRATGEDPGACEYHDRAQSLAPWFIETADPIDLSDDRWEIFYFFEEKEREVLGEKWRPSELAGFFTVFGFRNPVKGVTLRICQALVLPRHQRQGHGQVLLTFLYKMAREREGVFEVTVEDPAPGFEKLRNLVDAQVLRDHGAFPDNLLAPESFQRPPKDVVQSAHRVLKLTLSQVEIGFDVLKARDVNPPASASEHAASTTSSSEGDAKKEASGSEETEEERRDREEVLKKFRLMVKRRLLKRYGGGLSSDVSTRKGQLDELYGQVEGNLLELGVKLRAENGRA